MNATIRDVAKRAGVGLGTVSRVLNNSPLVSEETRQRVLQVIEELGYTPSRAARGLSLGKTLTISTIAPYFTRPSGVERLRGIEAALTGTAYNLVVFNVETIERRNACLREVPRRERSDGVLIISLLLHDNEVAAIQHSGVPVVLIDRYHPLIPSVSIDDVQGGLMATSYLISLGHRRIAFLGDALDPLIDFEFTSSRDRQIGYQQALATAGIEPRPDYLLHGPHGRAEARRLAHHLLGAAEPPTAIFAASDVQAMGVLEAARDRGRLVPGELSVIGFDDIDVAEYLNLTTVRQPLFASGVRGVELLLNLLESQPPALLGEILPIELVVRGSCAPPR